MCDAFGAFMSDATVERRARTLLIIAAVLMAWSAAVALTGGFRIELWGMRISSRNALRIFLIGAIPAIVAWRLAYVERLEAWLLARRTLFRRLAPWLAAVLALAVLLTGVKYGSHAVAASDQSGYISESVLWARWTPRLDVGYAVNLPWPNARNTLTPLGYRINPDGAMVPTYAPGMPLLMVPARAIASCGPYLVMPLCAALLVLCTFHLGRRLFDTGTAIVAAAMLACSPILVFMSLTPMADVPAAAFWIAALTVAFRRTGIATFLAALLTSVAILIRPNLVPLAIFPWLMAIVRCTTIREATSATVIFAAGSLWGPLSVAWINSTLYGSALTSGYGDMGPSFSIANGFANLQRYPAWWLESQGPLGVLCLISVWRRRGERAREFAVVLAFAVSAIALYLFYLPFDAWWYLRFVLPAVPVLLLLCADAVAWIARRTSTTFAVAMAIVTVFAASHSSWFMETHDVLGTGVGEERYPEIALHAGAVLPADAVVITMQHSGSLRYYTGRMIVRWDNLDPAWLDRTAAFLRERGLATYALHEDFEEKDFRERFSGQQLLAELDRGPIATARRGETRLYPLSAPESGRSRTPVVVGPRLERECVDISPDYWMPKAALKLR